MKKIYLLLTFCVLSFTGICQDKIITFNKHCSGDTVTFNELKSGSLNVSDSTCKISKFSVDYKTDSINFKEISIVGNKITDEAFSFLKLETVSNKKIWFVVSCSNKTTTYREEIYLILK